MLLNKINVSDKGFVAILSAANNGTILQDLQDTYFKSEVNLKLLNLAHCSLVVKCPLYVQLNLTQSGLDVISTPLGNVEAYIPDVSAIEGESLEQRTNVHNYIKATTEALILNQSGLQLDGCSRFTAQILTPISVYSEIIVYGSLATWIAFLKQKKLPQEIESYRTEIVNVLSTEWRNISNFI